MTLQVPSPKFGFIDEHVIGCTSTGPKVRMPAVRRMRAHAVRDPNARRTRNHLERDLNPRKVRVLLLTQGAHRSREPTAEGGVLEDPAELPRHEQRRNQNAACERATQSRSGESERWRVTRFLDSRESYGHERKCDRG